MFKTLSKIWFPLGLAGLLLLALPGVVLLGLNLADASGAVNEWMENHFSLTYHPAVPGWAAVLLLLLPPLIALLYFLKLKRKPLQVPSTLLWRKSIEDLHVNSLFQWLRDNLLLLLQILIVLILIYAVMAFQRHARAGSGRHYILMIDNSASMSVMDVAPNRLEQAKQEALNEIDAYTDNDFGMVLVFNSTAEILQSYTNDRNLLRLAVRNIDLTHRPTRIGEALTLADSLANPQRSSDDNAVRPAGEEAGKERTYVANEGIPTEVHLFSDGRFADVPDFSLGNLNLQFHSVGQPGAGGVDNVGLVTLNAVRDIKDPSALQVLATVQNFGRHKAEVRVRLEVLVNGKLKDIYDQPANSTLTVNERVPPASEGDQDESGAGDNPGEASVNFQVRDLDDRADTVLHAYLLDHHDQFADDDQAWLVVGIIRKARVLIVGKPNKPIRDFFDQEATQKVASVTYLTPEDLKDEKTYLRPAREGAFDLVIFDRCRPATESELPLANTLFIDALPPAWRKEDMPRKENVKVIGSNAKHPLMQYLTTLGDVHIGEYFQFDLKDPRVPAQTPRLLEADRDTTLLFTLPRASFTDVIMTFPLITDQGDWNTDWVKQISFPLFLRNLLYYLGNVSDAAGEETVQAGQIKTLRPDVPLRKIDVIDPEGNKETLERGNRPDFLYGKTDELGVYQVQAAGSEVRSFAVNLLDAEESNIEPRAQFRIGATKITPGEIRGQPRDLWHWITLAALVLILLEWYIYNRRIFV
ncbi:MAG: vWA domain-containing protein [Gemmataceae bacterium]